MRTAIVLFFIGLSLAIWQLVANIRANYRFTKDYEYAWNLADKSSTIEAKAVYIGQFVALLESNKSDFAENNARWLTTPDNSFEINLQALKTLDCRLHEIMLMDVKSFEYNTAIQQITGQEQGEAGKLIQTIEGCWVKENYPIIWRWQGGIVLLTWIIIFVGLFVAFLEDMG